MPEIRLGGGKKGEGLSNLAHCLGLPTCVPEAFPGLWEKEPNSRAAGRGPRKPALARTSGCFWEDSLCSLLQPGS